MSKATTDNAALAARIAATGRIPKGAGKSSRRPKANGVASPAVTTSKALSLDDFVAYMPMHNYVFKATREPWPASSVDARVQPWPTNSNGEQIKPSQWLDAHAPVEQMTWAPGEPLLIGGRILSGDQWLSHPECTTLNLYRPPHVVRGDPADVDPWLTHIDRLYGAEARDHIVRWLAHRVQYPGEKINHALVLGGKQGIGKDSILVPVRVAIGADNFQEVTPVQVLGRFNGFLRAVILRISEARDLGEVDRFQLYEHLKNYTAAPPNTLRCDEKNLREYPILNVCGVVMTSNHKTDGIYLHPDDRRHYVAWSERCKEDFKPEYWPALYAWYANGGSANVAAYLRAFDLSGFDAKAPPPKTEAFFEIVNAHRAPEDAELADVLDVLGDPKVITIDRLIGTADARGRTDFATYLQDRKNRRAIPHRLETAGYVPVRNGDANDGLWKVDGRRQAIYGRDNLSERERQHEARRFGQSDQ